MPIANTIDLKIDDFQKLPAIETIINDSEYPECQYYSFSIRSASRGSSDVSQKRLLEYLAVICEFTFEKEVISKGLKSYANFGAETCELPDIVDDLDLEILNRLVTKIKNDDILARIYDVIWCSRKKDFQSALKAIDYYFNSIKILTDIDYWPASIDRIERAVILAKTTNNHKAVDAILNYSVKQAESNTVQLNSFFSIKIAEFISEQKEIETYYDRIMTTCELKAKTFKEKKDYHKASDYYSTLAKICHNHSKYESEKKYLMLFAETEIEQGNEYICSEKKSYFNTVHHYQIAAEVLKKAGEDERYIEIHKKLLEYQQQALADMNTHSYQIDIGTIIEEYVKLFEPLGFYDSLKTFAQTFRSPTQDQIERYIKQQQQFVFKNLFPRAQLDSKGRTVAIAESAFGNEITDKSKKQMAFEYFHNHWTILSASIISVFLKHISVIAFSKNDLQKFIDFNPLIEMGRENFFINGLSAGLEYDFAESLHLLIPQVENMFRYVLSNNGVLTTKIQNGIQEDMDINQLFSFENQRNELERIFGKDIILDFEGLLVGRIGMNMRNKLAHGLLSYDECFSSPAVYLWALILKVVILGWLSINKPKSTETNFTEG
jgi:hypothetical protein